jgi:hypothetical protein
MANTGKPKHSGIHLIQRQFVYHKYHMGRPETGLGYLRPQVSFTSETDQKIPERKYTDFRRYVSDVTCAHTSGSAKPFSEVL